MTGMLAAPRSPIAEISRAFLSDSDRIAPKKAAEDETDSREHTKMEAIAALGTRLQMVQKDCPPNSADGDAVFPSKKGRAEYHQRAGGLANQYPADVFSLFPPAIPQRDHHADRREVVLLAVLLRASSLAAAGALYRIVVMSTSARASSNPERR